MPFPRKRLNLRWWCCQDASAVAVVDDCHSNGYNKESSSSSSDCHPVGSNSRDSSPTKPTSTRTTRTREHTDDGDDAATTASSSSCCGSEEEHSRPLVEATADAPLDNNCHRRVRFDETANQMYSYRHGPRDANDDEQNRTPAASWYNAQEYQSFRLERHQSAKRAKEVMVAQQEVHQLLLKTIDDDADDDVESSVALHSSLLQEQRNRQKKRDDSSSNTNQELWCWWGLERLYCPKLSKDCRIRREELIDQVYELQYLDSILFGGFNHHKKKSLSDPDALERSTTLIAQACQSLSRPHRLRAHIWAQEMERQVAAQD